MQSTLLVRKLYCTPVECSSQCRLFHWKRASALTLSPSEEWALSDQFPLWLRFPCWALYVLISHSFDIQLTAELDLLWPSFLQTASTFLHLLPSGAFEPCMTRASNGTLTGKPAWQSRRWRRLEPFYCLSSQCHNDSAHLDKWHQTCIENFQCSLYSQLNGHKMLFLIKSFYTALHTNC